MKTKDKNKPDPIPLLEAMAEKVQNEPAAQRAFTTFYNIYHTFLYKICYAAMRRYPGFSTDHVKFVVHNVFNKIYEKALSFNPNVRGKIIKATNDEKVKGWMEGIVKTETKLYTRVLDSKVNPMFNHKELDTYAESQVITVPDEEDTPMSKLSAEQIRFIDKCLATQPFHYQEVFKTRIVTKNEQGKVPPGIAQSLEQEFGVHPDYQRLIEKRVTDKIKAQIPDSLLIEPQIKNYHEKEQGNTHRQKAQSNVKGLSSFNG